MVQAAVVALLPPADVVLPPEPVLEPPREAELAAPDVVELPTADDAPKPEVDVPPAPRLPLPPAASVVALGGILWLLEHALPQSSSASNAPFVKLVRFMAFVSFPGNENVRRPYF